MFSGSVVCSFGETIKKNLTIGRGRCIPCSRDRWYVPLVRSIIYYQASFNFNKWFYHNVMFLVIGVSWDHALFRNLLAQSAFELVNLLLSL